MSTSVVNAVSVSDRGISATHLVAHPGTSPSVTVPIVGGVGGVGAVAPDVDVVWAHLAEPAEFFAVAMPSAAELADVLGAFVAALAPAPALTAATVTVVAGESRFVVTGTAVRPVRADAVRVDRCDIDFPLTLPEDPLWRRLAARTTSHAERDQLRGWLAERGFADAMCGRNPLPVLGAVLYECDGEVLGVDNPEPVSLLEQLQYAGVIEGVRRVAVGPASGDRAWWLSPDYELHPVSAIGDTAHPISGDAPSFVRLP